MSKTVDPKKTYVGVIENNNDPKKNGRCQIRVMDVFDNLKLEDLPWASPWKDLNGNQFNIPDKGKVVTVIFENGNTNNPEYISSDNYNINLEKKLNSLNETDYLSMKSVFFDHKTQLYVNDGEGLKIDHKFNNINIKENSINFNLKDNFRKVNIGSQNSTQRAILGDNFTNWFDTFLNILMGAQGGSFLGNLAAPVVATPALMSHIQLYFQLKDPKLLSKNVYIVDNDDIKVLDKVDEKTYKGSPYRFYDPTIGDNWTSTVEENKITKMDNDSKFQPIEGASSTTFDKPPVDADKPMAASELVPKKVDSHPDVDVLLELLKMKNYKIYDKPYELNIVSVRNQCLSEGDKYTDEFVDKLYALYKDDSNNWKVKQYVFSTVPGVEFTISESWLKQTQMKNKDLPYWSTKIDQKVTMKEFLKGAIVQSPTKAENTNVSLDNKPEKESVQDTKDRMQKVSTDMNSPDGFGMGQSTDQTTALKIAKLNAKQNLISKKASGLLSSLTSQGSGMLGNLTSQGSGILGNLTSQGSGILSNLTSQGSGMLGNLTNQGSGVLSNLTNQGSGVLGNLTSQGSGVLSNLTNQGSGILSNLTSQGSGMLGNLTSQGSGVLSNLTNQGSGILSNLTSQGSGILSNLTNQGSEMLGNLTNQGSNLLGSVTNLESLTVKEQHVYQEIDGSYKAYVIVGYVNSNNQSNSLTGGGLLSNLTNQGSGILSNLTSQGSGILSNLTNQGSGILSNLTNQGSGILSNLTSQGSGILSNLTSQGSGILGNLTNTLSSVIPMGDIKNLLSQGLDVDKVTNSLLKTKSLGIDLTKLDDINSLTQEELSKLSSSNINIVKLKSDLSLISSNTTLNITDILKSLK